MLEGTWLGSGEGEYPTISSFRYNERVTFTRSPKGFLVYQQSTSNVETGTPMHSETGYVRFIEESGSVEFVIAQPTGVVEIHSGIPVFGGPDEVVYNLRLVSISLSPSAKAVVDIERSIEVRGATLWYRIAMAAIGLPLQHHLAATLTREAA